MRMLSALTASCLACFANGHSSAFDRVEVDVELVLAADASGSMSRELRRLQRDGFVAALRQPEVLHAVLSGSLGRIAVTYVEWADAGQQRVVVPWRLVDSAQSLDAFADELEAGEPELLGGHTAIFWALLHAAGMIEGNQYAGLRKVIDLSGNGRNSDGPNARPIPLELPTAGIVVNCLALPTESPGANGPHQFIILETPQTLANYFESKVRTGAGSFVAIVTESQDYVSAIVYKLVLEIAFTAPESDAWRRATLLLSEAAEEGRNAG